MVGCTRATVSGLIAAVYLCSLTGCAGNGNGLDANGQRPPYRFYKSVRAFGDTWAFPKATLKTSD
jgi:hypothetical protein